MTFHAIVIGYEVDFRVDDTPVVIECDSFEFHDRRRVDFERDRRKKADLAAAGHPVVPITWYQLTREPKWVVAKIWQAVRPWLSPS
jgi:very-short-patch-repair endonuclease